MMEEDNGQHAERGDDGLANAAGKVSIMRTVNRRNTPQKSKAAHFMSMTKNASSWPSASTSVLRRGSHSPGTGRCQDFLAQDLEGVGGCSRRLAGSRMVRRRRPRRRKRDCSSSTRSSSAEIEREDHTVGVLAADQRPWAESAPRSSGVPWRRCRNAWLVGHRDLDLEADVAQHLLHRLVQPAIIRGRGHVPAPHRWHRL